MTNQKEFKKEFAIYKKSLEEDCKEKSKQFNGFSQDNEEDCVSEALKDSSFYYLSSQVRTLKNMSEEEILNLEKTYNCKVKRPIKK